ncbi:hypothetical protein HDU91_005593 [Kappamyces sp. JEL0680]|nr:hypothetical protein HDU91_005593 [Kappamyces sp. JEL0680]
MSHSKINSHRGSNSAFGVHPESRLWQPVKLGRHQLSHRGGCMAAANRVSDEQTPNELMAEYYEQRATSGGLLVTEATFIAREAGGYPTVPGIYSPAQIEGWKRVTDAVHAKGGIIYLQLWAIGRANKGDMADVKIVSSSTIPVDASSPPPEQMTIADIQRYLDHYEAATRNAMLAGFDGVEIHAAHGYLLDQFLQSSSNSTRDDEYSGSLENRARFLLQAMERVAGVIGEDRMAIRFSPFSNYYGMGHEEPFTTWGWVMRQVKQRYPKLAYVSITDPRMDPEMGGTDKNALLSSDYFRAIFRGVSGLVSRLARDATTVFPEPDSENPTLVFAAGGYSAADAEVVGNRTGDLIGYGRFFIANPDLVHRLKNGLELNAYDRSTFYTHDSVGYTDYPFADENTKKFVPPPAAQDDSSDHNAGTDKEPAQPVLPKELAELKQAVIAEPVNSHVGSVKGYGNQASRVWKPIALGKKTLSHRVVLAPLTRMRAIGQVPSESAVEYYSQRTTEGGLLITEATFISLASSGYPNAPGIYLPEQVQAWKKVTDAVHAKGGIIYCQLWNIGLSNNGDMPNVPIIAPGNVHHREDGATPHQMTTEEIKQHLDDYRHATKCAIEAGFDGVEQFLHPKLNCSRNDQYGGSLENRARFLLEALQACVEVIGQDRAAIRLSPFVWEHFEDIDPFETFGYISRQIAAAHPELAYVSFTEPRWSSERTKKYSNDYFRAVFRGVSGLVSRLESDATLVFDDPSEAHKTVFLSAGGYSAHEAETIGDRTGDLIAYGRFYIANPDLVHRLRNGLELNAYDRSTFYDDKDEGYTDYPLATDQTPVFQPIATKSPLEIVRSLEAALASEQKLAATRIIALKKQKLAFQKQITESTQKLAELEHLRQSNFSLEIATSTLEAAVAILKTRIADYQEKMDALEAQDDDLAATKAQLAEVTEDLEKERQKSSLLESKLSEAEKRLEEPLERDVVRSVPTATPEMAVAAKQAPAALPFADKPKNSGCLSCFA